MNKTTNYVVDYDRAAKKNIAGRIVMNLYAILSTITCIFPMLWLLYSSLKTQFEFDVNSFSLPTSPSLDNYVQVLNTTNMFKYMINSAIVSIVSVAGIVFISFIVGYFISRLNFKGRRLIFGLFLLGMLVPVHSLMVPMYVIFSRIGLTNKLVALILPYICFELPQGIYLAESYIHSIPREMEEAASIDGASFSYTLFRIILPIAKSILVTICIISFFYCWNEFSFALILISKESLRTVPLGLTLFSGSFTTNYPVMMAAMVIATFPSLLVYVFFSRKIMDGMVAGAIKG